jgi:type IV secretory pathway TrbL component
MKFVKDHPYISVLLLWPVVVDVGATAANKVVNVFKAKLASGQSKTSSVQALPPTMSSSGSQLLQAAEALEDLEGVM